MQRQTHLALGASPGTEAGAVNNPTAIRPSEALENESDGKIGSGDHLGDELSRDRVDELSLHRDGEYSLEERIAVVERFCGEIALARLAAIEAYERASRRLIAVLADEVLARELSLAPSDIDALARIVLETFAAEEPIAVVLSPSVAERVHVEIPLRADPDLDDDDLLLEVRDGLVDLRLNVRLTNAIEQALQ